MTVNPENDAQMELRAAGLRRASAIGLIALGAALAIVYTNVRSFSPEATVSSGYVDVQDYLAMYQDEPGRGIRGYRVLVPFLAEFAPAPPDALFDSGLDPDRVAAFKFGAVNLLFLVGATLLLHSLQSGFGFTFRESLFGIVFFITSIPVVRSFGLPMADTAFSFFFLASLLAVQRDRPGMLMVAVAIGVLAKELVLLVAFAILLSELSIRRKGWHIAALLPGIALYTIARVTVTTIAPDTYLVTDTWGLLSQNLKHLMSLAGVTDLLVLSFGVAWAPALWSLFRCELPILLRRWIWLIPLVVAGVAAGGGNLGRSTFTVFPVLIPLAALGLSSWVSGVRDFSDRPAYAGGSLGSADREVD